MIKKLKIFISKKIIFCILIGLVFLFIIISNLPNSEEKYQKEIKTLLEKTQVIKSYYKLSLLNSSSNLNLLPLNSTTLNILYQNNNFTKKLIEMNCSLNQPKSALLFMEGGFFLLIENDTNKIICDYISEDVKLALLKLDANTFPRETTGKNYQVSLMDIQRDETELINKDNLTMLIIRTEIKPIGEQTYEEATMFSGNMLCDTFMYYLVDMDNNRYFSIPTIPYSNNCYRFINLDKISNDKTIILSNINYPLYLVITRYRSPFDKGGIDKFIYEINNNPLEKDIYVFPININ